MMMSLISMKMDLYVNSFPYNWFRKKTRFHTEATSIYMHGTSYSVNRQSSIPDSDIFQG